MLLKGLKVPVPTVKDIERTRRQNGKLLTVQEDASAAQAAQKMSENHVGCLLVFNASGKFAGLLSERDMLEKVLAQSLSPDKVLVKDIMTTNVVAATTDTEIAKIEQLMADYKIRHVPIFDNGAPVAMVSSRDTIAYHLNSNKAMRAAAEQLAKLPAGLKSLDFDDVVELAINEVPKTFNADRAVFCLVQKDSQNQIVYRNGCTLPAEKLPDPDELKRLSQNSGVITDQTAEHSCLKCQLPDEQVSRILIPLDIHDRNDENPDAAVGMQGFLCMCRLGQNQAESEELLLYKASLLREVLSANLTNAKLYHHYQKARHDSEIDPLTDVGTRRLLEKALKNECVRAIRYNRPFSVAIIDVDNFKQINDSAGHDAGDAALKNLAILMQHSTRKTDIIGRFGGDEFVVVMPETRLNEALILLERLRRKTRCITLPSGRRVTISSGLAEWDGSTLDTSERILKRADSALYEAKQRGRNCVVPSRSVSSRI